MRIELVVQVVGAVHEEHGLQHAIGGRRHGAQQLQRLEAGAGEAQGEQNEEGLERDHGEHEEERRLREQRGLAAGEGHQQEVSGHRAS